jgi:hypothetical protein
VAATEQREHGGRILTAKAKKSKKKKQVFHFFFAFCAFAVEFLDFYGGTLAVIV